MDGNIIAILGGFMTTWTQLLILFYKVGKLEQKIDNLNKCKCKINKYERDRVEHKE